MAKMNFEPSPEGQRMLETFQHPGKSTPCSDRMIPGRSTDAGDVSATAKGERRNARTFTLHDPVDYRRQRIGKYLLTGEAPPIGWY